MDIDVTKLRSDDLETLHEAVQAERERRWGELTDLMRVKRRDHSRFYKAQRRALAPIGRRRLRLAR